MGIIYLIIGIIICIYIGIRADEMGYSALLWIFVSLLVSPILTMSFLSSLPNRKLSSMRQYYQKQLQSAIDKQALRERAVEDKVDINDRTISDLETRL